MVNLGFFLLVLFSAIQVSKAAPSSKPDFISTCCKDTQYPQLCIQSLSGYASQIQQSQQQLAQTALKVSLDKAKSALAFVNSMEKTRGMKPREAQAVKDCIATMSDSVDKLSQSINELGQTGKSPSQDFSWHMSNCQTWTSTALTDANTCMNGFARRQMDGNIKTAVRGSMIQVVQVTSNALALVYHFAEKHRPGNVNNP